MTSSTNASGIEPIGWLRSPWKEKFGVPRQPGLIEEAWGEVEFAPACSAPEARRGLEGFSHLWVTFQFHLVPADKERLMVRPPRLGGNEKLGVFATRSPFRPNRIGLSVCKIVQVYPTLRLSGVDLVDGTPILDLRPYISYTDSISETESGFAPEEPLRIPVRVSESLEELWQNLSRDTRNLITGMIALDPVPAFHEQKDARKYAAKVADWEVTWRKDGSAACIVSLTPATKSA